MNGSEVINPKIHPSTFFDVHSQFAKRMDCSFRKKNDSRPLYVTLNRSKDQRWLFPIKFSVCQSKNDFNAASKIELHARCIPKVMLRRRENSIEIFPPNLNPMWVKPMELLANVCVSCCKPLRPHHEPGPGMKWIIRDEKKKVSAEERRGKQAQVRMRWEKYLTIYRYVVTIYESKVKCIRSNWERTKERKDCNENEHKRYTRLNTTWLCMYEPARATAEQQRQRRSTEKRIRQQYGK